MVSILDDALLVSSDKHVVESNWDFSRRKYNNNKNYYYYYYYYYY
jgi:hypothetical protein